jgi:hypothetical protein
MPRTTETALGQAGVSSKVDMHVLTTLMGELEW